MIRFPAALRLLGALSLAATLASCAMIPAKLDRRLGPGTPASHFRGATFHELIGVALETPNEGRSALALGQFIEDWRVRFGEETEQVIVADGDAAGGLRYRVRFSKRGDFAYLPGYFDTLNHAEDFRVRKIEHHTWEGIGAPLLAVRENLGRLPEERHFPPEAITRAVTAVIHPGPVRGREQSVEIVLYDSLHHRAIRSGGRSRPLAADPSVALASLLQRTGALKKTELGDLLTPDPRRDPKLYLLESYDPDKEPLIMIHGLLDSPLAWAKLTNELHADPELRRRYQVWHFLYNTSAPALYSGRLLRQEYREIRQDFDPGRDDAAFRRVTVIAHSMGGIVTRGLITDPGDAFWDQAFTRPIGSLDLGAEDRDALRDAFFWKPEPAVRRVVFLAVPHRGSQHADNPVGRFGRSIVRPPSRFTEFYLRISEANPGAFTEEYRELGEGQLDSIGALSPEQPTLRILSDLPVGEHVALHSIVGDRGRRGPIEESSDGLVDYWSSHLDEAASELVVPRWHSLIDKPETIAEIRRILELP